MDQNNQPTPSKQTAQLVRALQKLGLKTNTEYFDGHKHIDIFLPDLNIYIEIDGMQHYTNSEQILTDFQRDYYSIREGHYTLRLTNQIVEKFSDKIADAISNLWKK